MEVIKSILYFAHFVVCLFLIIIVLLQRGEGEDLGGAFGGGGGGGAESFLGARGNVTLKKITVVFATFFFVISIVLVAMELDTSTRTKVGDTKDKANQTAPADTSSEKKEEK